MAIDPATGMLIASAVSSLFGNLFGASSSRRQQDEQNKANKEIAKMRDQTDRDLANQSTATTESMANPFRGQLDQSSTLAILDFMERAGYSPAKLDFSGSPYASNIPTMSGGFSYDMSPEARAGAGALKKTVLAGQTAPSMTNPANYGRTGAMDLNRLIGGLVEPWSDDAYADVFGSTAPTTGQPGAQPRGARGVPVRSPKRLQRAAMGL